MATSTFTISATPITINIQSYSDNYEPLISELITVIDPDDYDSGNSMLVATGNKKHTFSIGGYCTIADRTIFVTALRNSTKVYPVIYPNNGSDNIITSSAYYYIKGFGGSFAIASNYYWYTMDLVYGGV